MLRVSTPGMTRDKDTPQRHATHVLLLHLPVRVEQRRVNGHVAASLVQEAEAVPDSQLLLPTVRRDSTRGAQRQVTSARSVQRSRAALPA
jgi:hypothetical protein